MIIYLDEWSPIRSSGLTDPTPAERSYGMYEAESPCSGQGLPPPVVTYRCCGLLPGELAPSRRLALTEVSTPFTLTVATFRVAWAVSFLWHFP